MQVSKLNSLHVQMSQFYMSTNRFIRSYFIWYTYFNVTIRKYSFCIQKSQSINMATTHMVYFKWTYSNKYFWASSRSQTGQRDTHANVNYLACSSISWYDSLFQFESDLLAGVETLIIGTPFSPRSYTVLSSDYCNLLPFSFLFLIYRLHLNFDSTYSFFSLHKFCSIHML